jgi:hypothetical protein
MDGYDRGVRGGKYREMILEILAFLLALRPRKKSASPFHSVSLVWD